MDEVQELKEKIKFKEAVEKATNSLIREQSKKVKHLFPMENVAGYGQLCDKILDFEKKAKQLQKAEEFIRCINENWDCDVDAHRYDTPCRVCEAGKLLEKIRLGSE